MVVTSTISGWSVKCISIEVISDLRKSQPRYLGLSQYLLPQVPLRIILSYKSTYIHPTYTPNNPVLFV